MKLTHRLKLSALTLLATAAAALAAVVTIEQPLPETTDDSHALLRKIAFNTAPAGGITEFPRNYDYNAGTGATQISAYVASGFAVTAIGGTCTMVINSGDPITLPEGYTKNLDLPGGGVSHWQIDIANGTGTAHWSWWGPGEAD